MPIKSRSCQQLRKKLKVGRNVFFVFFLVEEAYTQQGRAQIRRLHPDWAARPALMSRAAHAVESKAMVERIKQSHGRRNEETIPFIW
jgi:hypothetical protein